MKNIHQCSAAGETNWQLSESTTQACPCSGQEARTASARHLPTGRTDLAGERTEQAVDRLVVAGADQDMAACQSLPTPLVMRSSIVLQCTA